MTARVRSMIAATYVKDIDASRAFYGLLGFREHSSGKAEVSAWSVMQYEGVSVLLASTGPTLDVPARARSLTIRSSSEQPSRPNVRLKSPANKAGRS